jgi:hypothetical protein
MSSLANLGNRVKKKRKNKKGDKNEAKNVMRAVGDEIVGQ